MVSGEKVQIDRRLAAPPQHPESITNHYQEAINNATFYAEWEEFNKRPEAAKGYRRHLEWLKKQLASKEPVFPLNARQMDFYAHEKSDIENGHSVSLMWEQRFKALHRHKEYVATAALPTESSTGQVIAAYLRRKRSLVDNGELSFGRYDRMRISLEHFYQWFGDKPIYDITSSTMLDWHSYLIGTVKQGKYERSYAKQHFDDLRQLLRYIYTIYEDYKLPRNFDDRGLNIRLVQNKVVPFTVAEAEALLEKAPTDRTKLFLLLALNCGMTQTDISQIYRHQIDYGTGYLTRKRGKTKWHKNTPTVSYKLWKPTIALLRQQDTGGDVLILNEAGKPLVRNYFRDDGKTVRLDGIGNVWHVLIRQFPEPTCRKTFKALRKTGATLLASTPQFFFCSWMYLGHSARTIAERAYIEPNQPQFDAALAWLGEQFGVATV